MQIPTSVDMGNIAAKLEAWSRSESRRVMSRISKAIRKGKQLITNQARGVERKMYVEPTGIQGSHTSQPICPGAI